MYIRAWLKLLIHKWFLFLFVVGCLIKSSSNNRRHIEINTSNRYCRGNDRLCVTHIAVLFQSITPYHQHSSFTTVNWHEWYQSNADAMHASYGSYQYRSVVERVSVACVETLVDISVTLFGFQSLWFYLVRFYCCINQRQRDQFLFAYILFSSVRACCDIDKKKR